MKRKQERINDILDELYTERVEQITKHGFDDAHDDKHTQGQIAMAAAHYALPPEDRKGFQLWPWDAHWFKDGKTRREQLKVAATLLVAEIERLDRMEQQNDKRNN